ncbi:hypothetical protein NDU88_005526 [Pleurodeles waltl]|uniref:Uncharacterized protein n=1 Tax=Pleurodeles waltl TaxID=8319 RepID=A0AAV7SLW9_PLEWA|nr:hypothetical protein NDU88_005526 [Pleurodeles waltl]
MPELHPRYPILQGIRKGDTLALFSALGTNSIPVAGWRTYRLHSASGPDRNGIPGVTQEAKSPKSRIWTSGFLEICPWRTTRKSRERRRLKPLESGTQISRFQRASKVKKDCTRGAQQKIKTPKEKTQGTRTEETAGKT